MAANAASGLAAWNNWIKACEIAWAAPQVIAMRLTGIAAAGATPDARDRAENFRMGHEKLQAFNESWLGIGTRMQRMQIELATQCWREGLRWWTRPWWLGNGAMPSMAVMRAPDFSPLIKAALDPVHRRVTGNVRRLSARKP